MEESEKRVLSQFRTRLANEIVVTGSFLTAFCNNSVLDDEMSRLMKSDESYVAKAHKLLDLLPKRGSRAFSTFLEILGITNPWIAEKMKSALHEERTKEAKLKINSHMGESASIEGYCASSLRHVDMDIKATANRFVSSTLHQLTESEQRNIEKWLSEELQRERRRQQYLLPNNIHRHPQEFQSTKEVQTETTGMEMQELCEDLIVQLYGVDYVKMNSDLSFKALQRQISELLARVHKMDFLFLECMDKFDDRDRYTRTLPELIDSTIHHQKELRNALMESHRKIQRLTDEKDSLERHTHRLEEEYEHLVKKQGQSVVYPQQLYLKKRREVQMKYTAMSRPARSQQQSQPAHVAR
ncbi:hypothetical protein C0Q70_08034 [Pomacea canaliculata]|uniref:CARD domain-containing protein n=1 Tax=Pomacea canaliculata TaxID=400727 RepID=A0A2T7PGP5_POMCA|nr:uncharacterized protein LOC112562370 [Pomacea canaliculata]PVD32592.1 hypothetical protein C0Q70_08034 [Pomacea canaliculata]